MDGSGRVQMAMILDERRTRILEITENKGFVSLTDLAEHIAASESTIRRDLEYLDSIGQIRRTRGGASYVGDSLTDFDSRVKHASTQKQRIARFAADLIQPGESILMDGGTTTLEVARRLAGKPLQVVTNSLPIAGLLVNRREVELIFIGGYLYPKTGVALGPYAVQALETIHVRRLVMSVGGVTSEGLFNSNALLVETERRMIESAEEVMVVCDSGKLGHSALAQLCSLSSVDRMVVDDGITDDWKKTLSDAGIELSIVPVERRDN
jgi:DeoR family fructose operon transcriptional repressor